jgi:single-stranded-DNA-specific exonuclease
VSKNKDEAEQLAGDLENKNQERQRQMERILEQVRSEILKTKDKSKIIFEADESWTSGLIGLVAQKLRDEFWRPAFICQLSKNRVVCSGRGGIGGFNVVKALNQCKDLLEEFGGHPYAGAFRAEIGNLDKIKKSLRKTADKELTKEDLMPFLEIDAEMKVEELNWKTFTEIQRFEPFGPDNPKPLFLIQGIKIIGMRNVGTKENHLKLLLEKEYAGGVKQIDAIGFNLVNSCAKIGLGDRIDIVFEILANEWNGTKELQLKIVDIKKK